MENPIAIMPESSAHDSSNPYTDEGFEQLVVDHHRELTAYANAMTRDLNTAREVVQDAFITAYGKLDTFDVTRDFAAWMRGIIRNKWREWCRRNRLRELPESEMAAIDAEVAAWQAARAAGTGTVFEALETCLDRLPENLRTAIDAVYYEQETGDEAAASLGISPAALRKRLQRSRELLRGCLEGKLNSPT